MSDLTVIIPVLDAGAALDTTLHALTDGASALDLEWEAIIVDMGSVDDTSDRLRRWLMRERRVRGCFLTSRSLGDALHRALGAAAGERVMIVEPGDRIDADGVMRTVRTSGDDTRSSLGVVTLDDANGTPVYHMMQDADRCTADDFFDRVDVPLAGMIIHRPSIGAVMPDPSFHLAADIDWIRRLGEADVRWRCDHNVHVHRSIGGSMSIDAIRQTLHETLRGVHNAYVRQLASSPERQVFDVSPHRLHACLQEHAIRWSTRAVLAGATLDDAEALYATGDDHLGLTASTAVVAARHASMMVFGNPHVGASEATAAWCARLYAWWTRCEADGWMEPGEAHRAWLLYTDARHASAMRAVVQERFA